jgi:hypothetical protein
MKTGKNVPPKIKKKVSRCGKKSSPNKKAFLKNFAFFFFPQIKGICDRISIKKILRSNFFSPK